MFLGHLLIGSLIGILASAITLILGHPLLTAIAAYFAAALLAAGGLTAFCALKHAAKSGRHHISASPNDL